MTDFDSDRENGHDCIDAPDLGDDRTRSALEDALQVTHVDGTAIDPDDDPTMVGVTSGNSERTHIVDVREDRCECEDHQYRRVECKHLRRAKIALGRVAVTSTALAAADVADIGASAPGPVVIASDGGVIEASDQADDVVQDDSSDRPDDCECGRSQSVSDLPCFACYRAGFESINREVL